MADRRVVSGGGSCAACRCALDLTAVLRDGRWYCDAACAQGEKDPSPDAAHGRVDPTRLLARPRRFFRARRPKELKSTRPGS